MKTIKIDGVVHIYKSHHGQRAWGFCHKSRIWPKRIPLVDGEKRPPTCPDCISNVLNGYENNKAKLEQMTKEHESSTGDYEAMIRLYEDMVHARRWSLECERGGRMEEEHEEGSYPFIPIGARSIYRNFQDLKEHLKTEKRWSGYRERSRRVKFLDAGCGIGNVMMLAKANFLAYEYHGLEYFEDTLQAAQTWVGHNPKHGSRLGCFVHKADILTYKQYNRFDIVYFYCPFSDDILQQKFEERLEDKMRIGAILVPRLKKSKAIRNDPRFEQLPGLDQMWIKVRGGKRTVGHAASQKVRCYHNNEKTQRIYKKYNFSD